MVDVLLVSDSRLFGEGLQKVLTTDGRLGLLALATTVEKALALGAERKPDVILLDMSMPEALGLARELLDAVPDVKIVALGLSGQEREVIACAEAGLANYLCRDGSLEDLIMSVREAVRGELSCGPRVASALFRRVATLAHAATAGPATRLSPREREVTRLLDRGLSNKEIARSLGIEIGTVKNHVHSILDKLEASTRGEAASKARELRLIPRISFQSA